MKIRINESNELKFKNTPIEEVISERCMNYIKTVGNLSVDAMNDCIAIVNKKTDDITLWNTEGLSNDEKYILADVLATYLNSTIVAQCDNIFFMK